MLGSGVSLTEAEAIAGRREKEPGLSTSVLPSRGSGGGRSSSSSVGSTTHHVSSAASVTLCLCAFLRPPRGQAWSGGGPPRQPLTDRGRGRHSRIGAEHPRLQSLLLLRQREGLSSRWSSTSGLEGRISGGGGRHHEHCCHAGIRVAFDRCHHHRRRVLSTTGSMSVMTESESSSGCGGAGAVEGAATCSPSSAVVATAASLSSSSPLADDSRNHNSNNDVAVPNGAASPAAPAATALAAAAKPNKSTPADHTSDGKVASGPSASIQFAANHNNSQASGRSPLERPAAAAAATLEKTPEERQMKDLGKMGRWREALAMLESLESPTEGQYVAAIKACEASRQPRQSLRIHSSMVTAGIASTPVRSTGEPSLKSCVFGECVFHVGFGARPDTAGG